MCCRSCEGVLGIDRDICGHVSAGLNLFPSEDSGKLAETDTVEGAEEKKRSQVTIPCISTSNEPSHNGNINGTPSHQPSPCGSNGCCSSPHITRYKQ